MWKVLTLLMVIVAVAHAAPPHHDLSEYVDEDAVRFGMLVDELVMVFKRGSLHQFRLQK